MVESLGGRRGGKRKKEKRRVGGERKKDGGWRVVHKFMRACGHVGMRVCGCVRMFFFLLFFCFFFAGMGVCAYVRVVTAERRNNLFA